MGHALALVVTQRCHGTRHEALQFHHTRAINKYELNLPPLHKKGVDFTSGAKLSNPEDKSGLSLLLKYHDCRDHFACIKLGCGSSYMPSPVSGSLSSNLLLSEFPTVLDNRPLIAKPLYYAIVHKKCIPPASDDKILGRSVIADYRLPLDHGVKPTNVFSAIPCTLLLYDWLTNLDSEIEYIWGTAWSLGRITYHMNRVWPIIVLSESRLIIIVNCKSNRNPSDVHGLKHIIGVFLFRCWALYRKSRGYDMSLKRPKVYIGPRETFSTDSFYNKAIRISYKSSATIEAVRLPFSGSAILGTLSSVICSRMSLSLHRFADSSRSRLDSSSETGSSIALATVSYHRYPKGTTTWSSARRSHAFHRWLCFTNPTRAHHYIAHAYLTLRDTMADTAFRKIDVDKLEEDVLLATDLYDPDPRGPDGALADAKAKTGQVRTALNTQGALSLILTDPPYGVEAEEAATTSSVFLVLASTKAADIPNILRSLEPEQHDTLMKYLYKGMALQNEATVEVNSSVLLTWHEKLTELAGTGCIVRVMTDRRVV
ncbi:P16-Arc domain-containing protein [Rhizoctonia solani AG-1 IA]|uniref:Actin-related protein 2/3 complex subunit 5 n=1 Tax=Thanatephorus cucumeris (strain AG1-IA) TaxID=983506 RepID=L8WQC4_THACA|nr:P16-Arc domain-containing protein [Rhizoctonia solani AG-1 IA]